MAEDLGNMIEKAMADPRFAEIFGMLKEKADSGELDVSKVGSLLGGSSEASGDTAEKSPPSGSAPAADVFSKIPDLMGILGDGKGSSGKGRRKNFANHERLLCALKPYLSDGKKNAVDTVSKAARLGDILELLGGASRTSPPTNKD